MNKLKFSVCMCVYSGDNAEWFQTAIDSILNQTIIPNEIVLVVDGPVTEELENVITKCDANPAFRIIRLRENQGHGKARQVGLKACTNELIAIMDADDISQPDRFKKQLEVFQKHPEIDVVGGNITEFVETSDNVIGERVVPCKDREIKDYMKIRCPMNLVTVMFKKNSVESVGGFIDWYCEEDYYLWVRMALADLVFANISDVLVNVRVGTAMYERRGGVKYFRSEVRLQNYMRKQKIIGLGTYSLNVLKRLIVQVMLPNNARGWVFKTFARKKVR